MRSVRLALTSLASVVLLALSSASAGCKAPQAAAAESPANDTEHGAEKEADPHAAKDGHSSSKEAGKDGHGGHEAKAKKYSVPFAAEGDKDDPLAHARGFFQGVFGDNATYMRTHDSAFFKSIATSQKPRATVVTCSDSRVQSPVWDATPENDDFMIRNIGNQVATGEGSVEYGVHHLKTSVLFILGHTGCGAVKAAMGDYASESEAIRRELDGIHVPKRKEGGKEDDPAPWLDGVVDNVHDQVGAALLKFEDEVAAGTLTIVGGVYDFRNDMKQGAGKITIVNVNGNKDAAKVTAFERGVLGITGPSSDSGHDLHDMTGGGGGHKDAIEIKDLKDLRAALRDPQKEARSAKETKEPKPHGDAPKEPEHKPAAEHKEPEHKPAAEHKEPEHKPAPEHH